MTPQQGGPPPPALHSPGGLECSGRPHSPVGDRRCHVTLTTDQQSHLYVSPGLCGVAGAPDTAHRWKVGWSCWCEGDAEARPRKMAAGSRV